MKITFTYSKFCYQLLVISSLLFSCKNDKSESLRVISNSFEKFPKEEYPETELIVNLSNERVRDLCLANDSTILLLTSGKSSKKFIYAYDINSKKKIKELLPYGKGPYEAIGAVNIGKVNDDFWVRDVTKKNIYRFSEKLLEGNKDSEKYEDYKLDRHYYQARLISDNNLLGSSHTFFSESDFFDHYAAELYDFHNKKVIQGYGEIDIKKGVPRGAIMEAHSSWISINNDKVVVAYRFRDAFEIFDLNDGTKLNDSQGPDMLELDFDFGNRPTYTYLKKNEKTYIGYLGATSSQEYIFLLYSGKASSNVSSSMAQSIHVFDWNAQPILELKFDLEISAILVDEKGENLFLCDLMSGIHKVSLNL